MNETKPTVGRIVHVNMPANSEYAASKLAALITRVHDDEMTVDLCIFGHAGFGWRNNVVEGNGEGQWQWPARV